MDSDTSSPTAATFPALFHVLGSALTGLQPLLLLLCSRPKRTSERPWDRPPCTAAPHLLPPLPVF